MSTRQMRQGPPTDQHFAAKGSPSAENLKFHPILLRYDYGRDVTNIPREVRICSDGRSLRLVCQHPALNHWIKQSKCRASMRSRCYEDFTARTTKIGQLYSDLGKEVFKPFAANISKTAAAK